MNNNPPKSKVRKGIFFSAVFLLVGIASILIDYKIGCPYLRNVFVLLTPVCFLTINRAYFGGTLPKKWRYKHLFIAALVCAALAIGLTWLGDNL